MGESFMEQLPLTLSYEYSMRLAQGRRQHPLQWQEDRGTLLAQPLRRRDIAASLKLEVRKPTSSWLVRRAYDFFRYSPAAEPQLTRPIR